jgi:uncharacterized membrane protein (DUF106 family)
MARPGTTVTTSVYVTGGSSGAPVAISTVGSVPRNSNFTVVSGSGSLPLNATITIHVANDSGTVGSYQIGVVAKSGSDVRVALFALHVVSSQPSSACASIGLTLPESTYLVTLTSIGLSLLTQVVTRRVVDLDKERKMKAELAAFNKEKREATLAKDKAKLDKLQKREVAMRQAQLKVQRARLNVTLITIVPLFGVYYLMATFLGGYGAIVAFSPIAIPYLVGPNGEMVLIWWYFLSSFTFSTLLSHLLHTTT